MKRYFCATILSLCIILLVGCSVKPDRPTDEATHLSDSMSTEAVINTEESEKPSNDHESTSAFDRPAETELDLLQKEITENGCLLGIGLFGYVDSTGTEKDVRGFISDGELAKSYPFLKETKPVLFDGAELYAFVPCDKNTVITVFRAEPTEDGSYSVNRDTPIYSGKAGEAVVLRCNLSEIHSNVLVTASNKTDSIELYPAVSLENGRLVQEKRCFDFSIYDTDEDNAVGRARELLVGTDEISAALRKGMKLIYTEDKQLIDGKECLLFALGTDNDGQFVREQLYAVSNGTVYSFNVENDVWLTLGED